MEITALDGKDKLGFDASCYLYSAAVYTVPQERPHDAPHNPVTGELAR
jgi:hypothetical protein